MADRLVRMDYDRGKVIVMRTFVLEDGTEEEREIELDLPSRPVEEGLLRRVKIGEDGRTYETEEKILIPVSDEKGEK